MVLRLEGSWSLLVGKRFLSLAGEDDGPWDTERVAEWPWQAGRIRAVSHTDISKQDLKVTGRRKGVGAGGAGVRVAPYLARTSTGCVFS